jgi:orotate phosphoribosyltransferase-like protein
MPSTGRPRRNVNPDRVEQLRAEGLSWREIADKLSVGLGTVHRAYQRRSKSVPKMVLQVEPEADPIAEAHKLLQTDWLYRRCGRGQARA